MIYFETFFFIIIKYLRNLLTILATSIFNLGAFLSQVAAAYDDVRRSCLFNC
jgi:hypothetical protein